MVIFPKLERDGSRWFVKWMDRFTPGLNRGTAPGVNVLLQRLDGPVTRANLSQTLARGADGTAPFRLEQINAGHLLQLDLGTTIYRGSPDGTLPVERDVRFRLLPEHVAFETPGVVSEEQRIAEQAQALLKPSSYRLAASRDAWASSDIDNFLPSRCFAVRIGKVRYVIPRTIIFKAFYGITSDVVNALCTAFWEHAEWHFVSPHRYKSGIETAEVPDTNIWRIVLQTGLTQHHAPLFAPFRFDDHARRCIRAIYTESLAPLHVPQSGLDGTASAGASRRPARTWLASARFPHRVTERGLELQVSGFRLADPEPSTSDRTEPTTFLVTAITGLEWPYPDRVVEWELHNSGAKGTVSLPPEEGAKPYGLAQVEYIDDLEDVEPNPPRKGEPAQTDPNAGQPVIEGDPNAAAVHGEDPKAGGAVSEYKSSIFGWLTTPPTDKQKKRVSQQYPDPEPRKGRPPTEPSTDLSTAPPSGRAEDAPDAAKIRSQPRDLLARFELLVQAIKTLKAEKLIAGFEYVSPSRPLQTVQRNGVDCWSLLPQPAGGTAPRIPARGWTVVFGIEATKGKRRERFARCVLAVVVKLTDDKQTLLLEIEPRSAGPSYRLIAMAFDGTPSEQAVEVALKHIRDASGTFTAESLRALRVAARARSIASIRHQHQPTAPKPKRADSTSIEAAGDTDVPAAAESAKRPASKQVNAPLRHDLLLQHLQRLASSPAPEAESAIGSTP